MLVITCDMSGEIFLVPKLCRHDDPACEPGVVDETPARYEILLCAPAEAAGPLFTRNVSDSIGNAACYDGYRDKKSLLPLLADVLRLFIFNFTSLLAI